MIENEQVYECKGCKAIINEKDVGSIKIQDFYRLYCPFCQSGEIKIIGGSNNENSNV
jgi:Zn finger protein HypA/HybF involved in hydrogenase expression